MLISKDGEKMTVGERIKEYRKLKGWSQKKLATESGVAEITIRQYENGTRTPRTDKLPNIATALNVNVTDLMDISNILSESKKILSNTTTFRDYLGSLGYVIGENDHTDYQMHILENDTYIELNSDDMKIINELENDTEKDIKRTLNLLIAAKNK